VLLAKDVHEVIIEVRVEIYQTHAGSTQLFVSDNIDERLRKVDDFAGRHQFAGDFF
jgi:hypothetical protein